NRENLGRGVRPRIASVVDLARTLEASQRARTPNAPPPRRAMELEPERHRLRGLTPSTAQSSQGCACSNYLLRLASETQMHPDADQFSRPEVADAIGYFLSNERIATGDDCL